MGEEAVSIGFVASEAKQESQHPMVTGQFRGMAPHIISFFWLRMEGRKAMKEEKANKYCSTKMKEAVFKEQKNSK